MKPSKTIAAAAVLMVAAFAIAGMNAPQAPPEAGIQWVDLKLKLPAIGNVSAVKKWRFGRLQNVEQVGGNADLSLTIRTADGKLQRVVAPRVVVALATASNWYPKGQSRPGWMDYAERMIAFDMDENGRLIAMISLEPIERDRFRLRQALDM